jgi:8-oxo-dGTP pyrophosphatase MutT (NUDIX family)
VSQSAGSIQADLRGVLLDPAEAAAIEVRATVAAAVLVPLHVTHGVVHAVFTERRHDLPRHAGEISFPGGRRDPEDPDLIATALREAHEEVGLPPDAVELIGALEPTPTVVSGYAIYPFVGLIPSNFKWTPSDAEVAQVIDLPLAAVAAGYGRRRLRRRGMALLTDTYVVDGHMVWGATARIVSDLLDRTDGILAGTGHGQAGHADGSHGKAGNGRLPAA